MIIAAGNRNDITQVEKLTQGLCASYLLADKGYDGKRALEAAKAIGAQAVIPQAPREQKQCVNLIGKFIKPDISLKIYSLPSNNLGD